MLTTWARPDLTYERWWRDLRPLLTATAQESYSYTDPANIPALKITGQGVEKPEPFDPNVTTFYYPTTKGRFGVDVTRAPGSDRWLGFSIIFPNGRSQRQ